MPILRGHAIDCRREAATSFALVAVALRTNLPSMS